MLSRLLAILAFGHCRRHGAAFVGILGAALLTAAAPTPANQENDIHDALARAIHGTVPGNPALRQQVTDFYRLGNRGPKWIAPSGQLTQHGRQALRILAAAADDGLDAADYGVLRLMAIADRRPSSGSPLQAAADFDVSLSAAMLSFARDIRVGRANPHEADVLRVAPGSDPELSPLVQHALDHDALDGLVHELRPHFAEYEALRRQLKQYRLLRSIRLDADALAVEPADRPARPTRVLVEHLRATGDLSSFEGVGVGEADQPEFRTALEQFQRRHGLTPDGIIGPRTRAALLVPFAERIRQIELSLERLRWLPRIRDQQVLAIDIPMFRLWGWENWEKDAPSVAMNVIVGRARGTPTPISLSGDLREIVFRPFWNVPRSIMVKEVLPMATRDRTYLVRENMEIVRGEGDDADVVEPIPASLAGLHTGTLRLRQRPGPRNALGLAKFAFANVENVYLHDTPGRSLFTQARRDFSHGCVRVENPVELATWVLGAHEGWGSEQVLAAMQGTNNRRVPVLKPPKVVVFYATALVMPEDGFLHFAEDIYGQDVLLARKLTSLSGR